MHLDYGSKRNGDRTDKISWGVIADNSVNRYYTIHFVQGIRENIGGYSTDTLFYIGAFIEVTIDFRI